MAFWHLDYNALIRMMTGQMSQAEFDYLNSKIKAKKKPTVEKGYDKDKG
jgi:hypothetical protein